MNLILTDVSHRYDRKYIFKNLNINIQEHGIYIVSGKNGSGKSTFLKIAAGCLTPTKGQIHYVIDKIHVSRNDVYRYINFTSPYIQVFTDLTLEQNIKLISSKHIIDSEMNKLYDKFQLSGYANYLVKHLSSGLYQRFKLLTTYISDSMLVILDEPTSNLDENGKKFVFEYVKEILKKKIVIIATNEVEEINWGKALIEF